LTVDGMNGWLHALSNIPMGTGPQYPLN